MLFHTRKCQSGLVHLEAALPILLRSVATLLVACIPFLSTSLQAQIITTVAGSDLVGDGGNATAANLTPTGVAVDGSGNLYIADQYHSRVRKVAPNGTITTVVGGGSADYNTNYGDGGPATQATLGLPKSVVLDGSGSLYVVDSDRIRKIAPDGVITTVAGGGTIGSGANPFPGSPPDYIGDGSPATSVYLNNPADVALDGNGNLYIADTYTNRIRKVDTNGIISTVVGGGYSSGSGDIGDFGPASSATLSYPNGIAFDAAGNLYIADQNNNRIRKVDTNGMITSIAGGTWAGVYGDGGPASEAILNSPVDVVLDGNGNIYISDQGNIRIRKIDTNGIINTIAGNSTSGYSGDGGQAINAIFGNVMGIAADGTGNVFIADQYNYRVRKIASNGIINTIAGNGYFSFRGDGGPATSASISVRGVAVDGAGNTFLADSDNQRIRKVGTNGIINTIAGNGTVGFSGDSGPATSASLNFPIAVAVDATGNVYIADANNHRIRKIATNGQISTVAGNGTASFSGDGGQATAASLNSPGDVAVDGNGNLFIMDAVNLRIRKVDANGIITTVAGNGSTNFSGDGGQATAAGLRGTIALDIDGNGNLFILTNDSRVRKVTPAGIISTVAGDGSNYYRGDGLPATAVGFYYPLGIAVDGNGNLFISDNYSTTIRMVTTNGFIRTIAGNGTHSTSGDGGPALEAGISYTGRLTTDANNNLFISSNNRIRKVSGFVPLPTISLGTSPTVCSSASSFAFTYTATTGGPNQYTVTGDGVAAGQTGTLTGSSGSIPVNVYPESFTGSFSLVVANTTTGLVSSPIIASVSLVSPAIRVSNPQSICPGRPTSLTVSGGVSQVWSTGATTASISVTATGIYSVTVTNASGCSSTTFVSVSSLPVPSPRITVSQTACPAQSAALTVTGGNSFTWSTGATSTSISVTTAGPYSVTAANTSGCTNSASVTVSIGVHPDYAALVDLYNATNGNQWTNKAGWLTNCNPCNGWNGITCTANRVTWVALSANNLVGTIPASLSTLTALNDLSLNANQLSGTIPASLSALTNLQYLSLGNNQLSGAIPPSLGTLTNLLDLSLGNNQLTGTIPNSLSALSNLQYLSLYGNQLSGSMPTSLSALTNLQNMALGINQLTGSIPTGLGTMSRLEALDLSNNKLTGNIPGSLSALTKLYYLTLNGNQLTGNIPTSFSALTKLSTLKLANNQLTGSIPFLYCYQELDLSYNQLTGPIPTNLPTLNTVRQFRLNNNQLTGPIPENFGNMEFIEFLSLTTNQLSGCYPASLSALCGKYLVNFSDNSGLPDNGNFSSWCATGIVSATTSTSVICVGGVISLSATGGTSYLWSGPASFTASGQTPTRIASSTAMSGIYSVTATNGTCSYTASTSVMVSPPPTAVITGNLTVSGGNSTTLTASGGVNFLWSTGATTASISVSATGPYSVTVTSVDGCIGSTTVTVTSATSPTASISGNLTICSGSSTTLTASGGTSFTWSTGATTASVSVSIAGAYSVTVGNGSGLTSTTAVTVTVLNGMYTIKAGNWNDATVWSCGRVPISIDSLTLNHAVALPTSYTGLGLKVSYNTGGRLTFGLGSQLKLTP